MNLTKPSFGKYPGSFKFRKAINKVLYVIHHSKRGKSNYSGKLRNKFSSSDSTSTKQQNKTKT